MEVKIRPIQTTDAVALHRIYIQDEVLPNMVFLPSMRINAVENRIRNLGQTDFEFVAELDGIVVGFIGMSQKSGRRSHFGELFIGVDSEHHNKGIGIALLSKMLDLADNWLMLERIELGVLETNPGAQALYEKVGFIVEGKKKGAIRANGRFIDETIMGRYRPNGLLLKS
ncbi:GNAT family N-acetyltransferase [Bacillus sp. DJP31]|uniref:GNAT family N-acetyltransferase n=1 Tax=Bacillus sp. DJP31 TaxID=3409789 RepID=UPI003BB54EA3